MKFRTQIHLFCTLCIALLVAFTLASAQADTPLTQWTITANSLTATNTNAPVNFYSDFTAGNISSGSNFYSASTSLTPLNTWYRLYTNSPISIPTNGFKALSIGRYFTFDTVVSAGYNIEVDAISGLILGKSANTATNAALYYSTNNGMLWLQAGGTVTMPSNSSTNDYSSIVNTGMGTNTYTNGGVTTVITNSGLTTAPIDFDNSTNSSAEDVKWALAFWGGGNGRVGIGNGGNIVTLSGNVITVPEPTTYSLIGFGSIALLIVLRRKKTA